METKFDVKIIIILILIAVIGIILYFPVIKKQTAKVESGKSQFLDSYEQSEPTILTVLPITQSTTCSFNRLNEVSFSFLDKDNKVSLDPIGNEKPKINYSSSAQSKALDVSFVDLDTKNPKMVANNGQDNLVKIYEDDQTLQMIEETPLNTGNVIVYTIFKKEGIASWSKQYRFLGTPYAYMGMGYCK